MPSLPAIVEALAEGRYDLVHLCSPGPGRRRRRADRADRWSCRSSAATTPSSPPTRALRTGDARLEAGARRRARPPSTASADVVLSPSAASDDVAARRSGIDAERDRALGPRRRPRALLDPRTRDAGAAARASVNVLYAGRLTSEKGADLLADAFLARARARPAPAPAARRRRPRGGRAARAPRRRTRRFLGWLEGDALAARLRERRPLPLRQPHRHLRPGPARGAGQRAAGRRGRRGRPVLDRRGRRAPACCCPPDAEALADAVARARGRAAAARAPRARRRWRRCASAPGSARSGRLADGYRRALGERQAAGARRAA